MPSPTQLSNGSICLKVKMQTHLSISGTEDNGIRTATEFFLVEWSAPTSSPTSATKYPTTVDSETATDGTSTVPSRGTQHPFDATRFASRIEARPCENNTHLAFQLRVEYTDDGASVINPLLAQPVIEWDTSASDRQPYFLDNNQSNTTDPTGSAFGTYPAFNTSGPQPTINTAGQRFAEFLQRFQGQVTATFSVNVPVTGTVTGYNGSSVSAFNASQAILYLAGGTNQSTPAINSDTFNFDGFVISPNQARAVSCTCGGIQIQNGVKFRTKKWTLAFSAQGWLDYVENRGFKALQTTGSGTNVLNWINTGVADKPEAPWPLYLSGHAFPNSTDRPPLLTFWPYPQKPFSPLGFY